MKFAFVGDIMPGGVLTFTGGFDNNIIEYLSTFDFRIGTLETAFGNGNKFCHIKTEIVPDLSTVIYSPDETITLLKKMKIDLVTLANNHICDCDLAGLEHTIKLLDAAGIKHVGAGINKQEAEKPVIIEKNGKTFCFLAYLREYHYLYRGPAYIPTKSEGDLNLFNLERILYEIKKYKKLYDYVFILPHWGAEGSLKPRIEENRFAKQMIKAGANGVFGSHSHVVQPIYKFHKGIIAMSLGNFLFPDRYVIPPRITYYPSEEERKLEIPTINAFKKVDKLTLKIVSKKERLGVILGINIQNQKIKFNSRFVFLNEDNNLLFTEISSKHKAKLRILSLISRYSFKAIEKILSRFEKKKNKFSITYY